MLTRQLKEKDQEFIEKDFNISPGSTTQLSIELAKKVKSYKLKIIFKYISIKYIYIYIYIYI